MYICCSLESNQYSVIFQLQASNATTLTVNISSNKHPTISSHLSSNSAVATSTLPVSTSLSLSSAMSSSSSILSLSSPTTTTVHSEYTATTATTTTATTQNVSPELKPSRPPVRLIDPSSLVYDGETAVGKKLFTEILQQKYILFISPNKKNKNLSFLFLCYFCDFNFNKIEVCTHQSQ